MIRPQDLITKGKGTIQILDPADPLRITGTDTQFTKQFMPRDMIAITGPNKETLRAEVVQVISDTELVLKKEFKYPELLSDAISFKCLPHVEQDAVYKAVHDELNNGGCIVIFPEGGSHDRVEMLPLKGNSEKF